MTSPIHTDPKEILPKSVWSPPDYVAPSLSLQARAIKLQCAATELLELSCMLLTSRRGTQRTDIWRIIDTNFKTGSRYRVSAVVEQYTPKNTRLATIGGVIVTFQGADPDNVQSRYGVLWQDTVFSVWDDSSSLWELRNANRDFAEHVITQASVPVFARLRDMRNAMSDD